MPRTEHNPEHLVSRRALVRTGLATAAATTLAAPAAVRAQDATPSSDAGFDGNRAVAAVDAVVAEIMERTGVPGIAVGIVVDGEIAHAAGYGLREAGKPESVDADTVFQLASVSKPMATAATAAAVAQGLVGWDDPISRHLPEFGIGDDWITAHVTLRDGFCHRTGLPDHVSDDLLLLGYSRDDLLRLLRHQPQAYDFRAGFAYTNMAFSAAGFAAAAAAGMDWFAFMDAMLFAPAGMATASASHQAFLSRTNRATPHVPADVSDLTVFRAATDLRDGDVQAPAGGASASVTDMARFAQLMAASGMAGATEIIPAAALGETWLPINLSTPSGDPGASMSGFYGLGWNVNAGEDGLISLSHSGAFSAGAATCVAALPAHRFGVTVLSNAIPVGAVEAIAAILDDYARYGAQQADWLEIIGGYFATMLSEGGHGTVPYAEPPANAAAPRDLDQYVGRYDNPAYDGAIIALTDAGLTIQLGATPVRTLAHFDGDTFVFRWIGGGEAQANGITFGSGHDGGVTNFVLTTPGLATAQIFNRLPGA